jgi:hypothetical protein
MHEQVLRLNYLFLNLTNYHLSCQAITRHNQEIDHWYNFVRCAEIKAFVDQIVAPSIRVGVQNLLMVRGP